MSFFFRFRLFGLARFADSRARVMTKQNCSLVGCRALSSFCIIIVVLLALCSWSSRRLNRNALGKVADFFFLACVSRVCYLVYLLAWLVVEWAFVFFDVAARRPPEGRCLQAGPWCRNAIME